MNGKTMADDAYRTLTGPAQWREYYDRNGYVVIRGLVPALVCQAARQAYEQEVKPYPGYLYRQASANPERHELTAHGHMLNSLLNIQDFDRSKFPGFRSRGMEVITHSGMQGAVQALLGEPGRVVQSMYFEGNPVTWAHQDTYYLDSSPLGSMTAAWIALEDIHPGAGRFYVYPGSHRIDMVKNGGDFDIAFNHDRYKQLVLNVIKEHGLECRAPALATGDVLFWSSKTMHGSLPTTEPAHSRSSITAHFIPESRPFLQYQRRERALKLEDFGGVKVHCPKDQNKPLNRAMLAAEVAFPGLFQSLKRLAIKLLTG